MADVASPDGDNGLVAATPEGCRAPLMTAETDGTNGGKGDMAAADNRVVNDKVSIHEILEGMTNEFNKGVSPTKNNDSDKLGAEEMVTSSLPSKVVDEVSKSEGELDGVSKGSAEIPENVVTSQILKENHKSEEEGSPSKQEATKKDSKARIVLTFRTINEKTHHGKKTKISSNLKKVPEELANLKCDQIGGVSVKIENLDDISDAVEESQAEESQAEESQAEEFQAKESQAEESQAEESQVEKSQVEESQVEESQVEEPQSEKSEVEETKKMESTKVIEPKSMDEDKVETVEEKLNSELPIQNKSETTENNPENCKAEDTTQQETTAPVTRKRRIGRPRLRALSDSVPQDEEPPGPKRSARRLCKESVKSTVLESAMARKEKSNYTEEYKKRRYNRPGRPKKIIPGKEQAKQMKSSDAPQEMETSLVSDISMTESTMLESSRNTSLSETSINDSVEDLQSFSSDFEGMPKLTPMTRSSESQNKLSNSIGSPGSDDIPLADIQKPFLKPATQSVARSKRERGRPRGSTQAARKIAKTDLYEDGSPSVAEAGKNNDYPEDLPVKRTRRSMVSSPSPAEGQASKPESTAIMSETYMQSMLCLCQIRSQLYVTITGSGAPLYCTAIDSIDNRIVGCCNEVDANDVAMRRPSTRVPFIILCRMHKERLLRHNCCPSCGMFCSQGRFVQCTNGHQYHRECEIYPNKKGVCPHCGSETSAYDVLVTLNGMRRPVFIPTRKKFSKLPSAKMSLPGKGDNTKLAERPPSPLVKPDVIKIPEPSINTERPERYTIMSLYTSVKNGDLEKLVNVLACGYNANHTFRDYAHRTGLHIAADKGHLSCVHVLVQAGAQVDVMDRNQLTPLMLAAIKGDAAVVKYLVRTGADVTLKGEDGMTALHMAAKSGHLEVCKIILTECKVPRTLVDCVDDGGWTSLIWACEFCHADVARYLLDKKCDPLIRDAEQNIALHWSAFSGSSEITEMLLNEGCDVNAVNVHGDTPLHIAARQDQYAVSVLLLARGAKIGEVNAAGETAVNCCASDGDTMAALRLNAKVNELSEHMWEKTVKILTNDISRGKETNPVQCVNGYDSEDKPTDFVYVTENCFTSHINVDRTITSLQSCRCEDNCSSEKCLCGNISLRCWYDEEGKLIPEFNYSDPPMLFECNPACDCNRITCNNRVIQHGPTQRFQLFRTKGKGWGLRTLRLIPKGTYVCEYVGEIISDSEADHREDDSYLFDLDNRFRLRREILDNKVQVLHMYLRCRKLPLL
ncbi:histone-lysine N-methyltransferase EHMT1 isoform X2 [Solenopsis invicta]|uniref:histone-lysine N-methyltransferase EHMT1 isoform X2 n=1 Tax=Solenopsis invicta TaxID=13686 RepID=UPI00193DD791|nr:histone-lysine N-methyltransferase EHMT1 isoform X2 [Solenopsis invicta]